MYFVYVLQSVSAARTYVGQTEDVSSRLKRHNAGLVRSTKAYRPWKLVHVEEYHARSEAMVRERWLKSLSGRRFIAEILQRCAATE